MLSTTAEPGLWVNPDHQSGATGVYALIIGVSRYDHLENGKSPASETFKLAQLPASALTAYRYFNWLRNDYRLSGWPVVRVRLLLSPQRKGVGQAVEDELKDCDAVVCGNAPEATYANCKSAIQTWYAEMSALPASAQGRSLFFFSGHGMELRQNYQMLLPSNYLEPPGALASDAISTRNLLDCLPYLKGVASHVQMLDGCRNDIDKLRGILLDGNSILNDRIPGAVNPLFENGVLHSTAAGLQAFSPTSPGSLSLFGRALLEGLRNHPVPYLGEPPIKLRKGGQIGTIEFNNLASYLNGRIAVLIKASNESVVQVVRSDVSSFNPGKAIDLAEVVTVQEAGTGTTVQALDERDGHGLPLPGQDIADRIQSANSIAWFQKSYKLAQKAVPFAPPAATGGQLFDHFHKILGSEDLTEPWRDTLRISGLSNGKSGGHAQLKILSSAQAERTGSLHRVRIRFRVVVIDPIGHVLSITDKNGCRYCCVLPADATPPAFQLEIDIVDRTFVRFSVYLSPQQPGPAGAVANAWSRMRALDAAAAAGSFGKSKLAAKLDAAFGSGGSALASKSDSPLAAAIGAVLLLKGNRFDLMHDWTRNLANWFPSLPDGVVLWTEQSRRMAAGKELDPELISWLVQELSSRCLPFTADGLSFLADILHDVQNKRIKTDRDTHAAADKLSSRVNEALAYFRDTGTFCTFAGWPSDWKPEDVLGLKTMPSRSNRKSKVPVRR